MPKWCSAGCRQRAWEQSRAATSGRSTVHIVERGIKIPVEEPAPPRAHPRHAQWIGVLNELAEQLDTGASTCATAIHLMWPDSLRRRRPTSVARANHERGASALVTLAARQ